MSKRELVNTKDVVVLNNLLNVVCDNKEIEGEHKLNFIHAVEIAMPSDMYRLCSEMQDLLDSFRERVVIEMMLSKDIYYVQGRGTGKTQMGNRILEEIKKREGLL